MFNISTTLYCFMVYRLCWQHLIIMTIYRIYSDKQPDTMLASSLVCSVVVVANSEKEAKQIVEKKHGDNFVCDYRDVKTEAICGDNQAMIVNVEYFNDSHY